MRANTAEAACKEVDFKIHAELLRFITYIMFWLMVMVAMFVTTVVMKKDLTSTPLIDLFGYNNICIYWDYSPAREVAAVIYPFVELPLVAYIVMNFLTTREFWQAGRISNGLYIGSLLTFPMELVLALLFRMIFVIEAFVDVQGHTAPFLGLQIALCLVASKNLLVDLELGKVPGRKALAVLYVLALILVSATKVLHALLLMYAGFGLFDVKTPGGRAAAHALDILWLVLAAVIPAVIAFVKMRATPAITIKLDIAMPPQMSGGAAAAYLD